MERRTFLETASLAAAASLVPGNMSAILAGETGIETLRGGTGVFTRKGGTIGWYLGPAGTVVIDTQYPETAPECLAAIRSRTDRILDAVLNTHHHADHTGGNGVFRPATTRIVAQAKVPGLQKAAAERKGNAEGQVYADTLFETTWSLALGAETVHGRHIRPAHTGGDAVFHFERANVTHLGDLVFHDMVPVIDRPGGAHIAGWIAVLGKVLETYPKDSIFIYGHAGEGKGVSGGVAPIAAMRAYLSGLLDYVRKGMKEGKTVADLAKVERIPGFPDHAPRWPTAIESNVQAAWEELGG